MKKLICIFVLLFATNSYALTTYKGGTNVMPEPLPESDGQLIYEEMGCPICHGHQGAGDGFMAGGLTPKPRDFTDFKIMNRIPDLQMYESIKNGIPDSAMPAWNLSDEQIWDVISYIKTFLADSQLTISICLNEQRNIDINKLDMSGDLELEVDNSDYMEVKTFGNLVFINPNDTYMIKYFKRTGRKVARAHVRVSDDNTKALITTRIVSCVK